ncbi:hypothetical protein lerEdw1_009872 [Lerista edwardsae]|nr:hypothetical protein lerEdw1_009872 [Lerista edwardsae]
MILPKLDPMDTQRKVYCALSGINLALLSLITAIPLWQYYHVPGTYFVKEAYFIVGLWAVCESNRCHPLYATDVYMTAVRALVITALLLCFFAFISAWEILSRVTGKEMPEAMVSFGGHFSTGTCLMIALLITFVRPTVFGVTGYFLLPHLGFYIGCLVCFLSFVLGTVGLWLYIPESLSEESTQTFPWSCPLNFYRNVFCVVACIHFILVVFITVTPFWVIVKKDEIEVILGFWAICYQLTCHPFPPSARGIMIFQALMVLACISLFIVLVPARNFLNHFRTQARQISEGHNALVAEFCAGAFLALPIAIIGIAVDSQKKIYPYWNFYILPKLDPMDTQRKVYCALSGINLALLSLITAIPLWQYYHVPGTYFVKEAYFIVGLWAVCESNRCHSLYATDVYMTAVRALVITALLLCFFAFISAWEILSRVTGKEMPEAMVSFGGHFSTGTCLMIALLITFVRPTVFGVTGYFLLPHLGFYIGCLVCFLSFFLGTAGLLSYSSESLSEESTQTFPWSCPLNFYRNVFCVVACIHFILVVFITVTPFWVIVKKDEIDVILGFWAICYQLTCHPFPPSARGIMIFQALMVLACISLFIVLVPARNFLNRFRARARQISEGRYALVAEFCAGVLNMIWYQTIADRLQFTQVAPMVGSPPPAPHYAETPL